MNEKQKPKFPHYNLFLRTYIYTFLIILISLNWYFGSIPIVSNFLHDVENKTYDLLFVVRHNLGLDPKVPKNIVIVGIDASSVSKVGVPWPWPRQFHAALIDTLVQAKAKFIFFDIIFDTISPLSLQTQDILGVSAIAKSSFDAGKEDDDLFASSIAKAMNVFLAGEIEPLSNSKYQPVLPITTFFNALGSNTTFLGNASVTYDRDNFIRKAKIIYPELLNDPALASSIALRVAQKYLNERAKILSDLTVQLGKNIIPNPFLINFYGPAETITTIPYWKALELIYKGEKDFFKDKIIYIGRTKLRASIDPYKSVRSPDAFPTPFASLSPNFSGVEIQATMLANILENNYITKLSLALVVVLVIIVGCITALIVALLRTRLVLCFYICILLSLIYSLISFLFFVFFKISIPPTFPVYGIIIPIYFINFLDQYFFVDWNRRRQAKIFRQLVPGQVADDIERMDQEQLALGGKKTLITVLFTDIQNFTGLCEKNTPETVVNILNQFFSDMVKVIHKHNGLVDKFIGDAIMALWGSPKYLEKEAQANLAAQCALAMTDELKMLNQLWGRFGLKDNLTIRIGINTDEAITGNVGSLQRMQFSAIGDGVNVASRLEAANKIYGTTILLSDKTVKLLDKNFCLREIDTVILPGKDTPVNVFELLKLHTENNIHELIKRYSIALDAYRKKDFDNAIQYWENCLKINPNDKPSEVMLQRVLKLKKSGISEDWQAIWSIETK